MNICVLLIDLENDIARGSHIVSLASSAANQGDNTVSVAQGGTATPGATEQLLPPDRVFKKNKLCIHKIN